MTGRGTAKPRGEQAPAHATRGHASQRTRQLGELRAFTAELARRNEELLTFASAVSHDLREPIRKVRTYAERLLDDAVLSAHGIDAASHIREEAERMQALVDDLLAYSRVTTEEVLQESVDLSELVAEVIAGLEFSIRDSGATVVVERLPIIRGHRRQLAQLFHNLLGNAIKFRRPGVAPHVRVHERTDTPAHLADDFVFVACVDNGIGVAADHHEHIFRLFQRLHHHSQYEGTGVGLAICHKVVQHHKGSIRVESNPDWGCTFTVGFPRHVGGECGSS